MPLLVGLIVTVLVVEVGGVSSAGWQPTPSSSLSTRSPSKTPPVSTEAKYRRNTGEKIPEMPEKIQRMRSPRKWGVIKQSSVNEAQRQTSENVQVLPFPPISKTLRAPTGMSRSDEVTKVPFPQALDLDIKC